jgi:adenylate cyclase
MPEGERRLAAIMFTDLVGYTALGQRNESLSLALVEEQRRVIRPVLARHGGREVKTIGDAFLVEFPNAIEAVRCAYDIQRAVREFNLALAPDRRIHLRVGVHVGEVVESQGDISGDAVNVASRIEPLAEDGGVCISQQVYDHVRNKVDVTLASMGPKPLKNVALPLEVYKMVMPWRDAKEERTGLERKRVAVLPLTNLSPNPDDRYFADGMTEELISAISRVPGLRVISRTSVMQYRDLGKRVSDIGRELGAGTLLEGSVRKAGNRIRITAQLIDSSTDDHLWAENYDRDLDDVFAIQSEVAAKVATSLQSKLATVKQWKDTDDVEAYTLYVRAMQHFHEGTEASLRSAIGLLSHAASRDPGFVRALAGLSRAWGALSGINLDLSLVHNADEYARRAVEKGPEWAEAHVAMSENLSFQDRFLESIAEAEKAVEINPNLSETWGMLGILNLAQGTLEQALSCYTKAHDLDPLSWDAGQMLAVVLWFVGRREESLKAFERLRELNPANPGGYLGQARLYVNSGEYEAAQKMVDAGREVGPELKSWVSVQGAIYALTGRRQEAEEQLALAMKFESEALRLEAQLAIWTALGDLDEAFKALMRQAEIHSWVPMIRHSLFFAELRRDPRYLDFCRKVGIPP